MITRKFDVNSLCAIWRMFSSGISRKELLSITKNIKATTFWRRCQIFCYIWRPIPLSPFVLPHLPQNDAYS